MSTLIPKTRLEQFLAKIAGRDVAVEPKTRLEKFLAKIAGETIDITPKTRIEQLLNDIEVGGGGGSSDISTATVTLINSSESSFTEATITGLITISEGEFITFLDSEPLFANGGQTITKEFVVYKNQPVQAYVSYGTYVSSSGAVEYDDGDLLITGDFTITLEGTSN